MTVWSFLLDIAAGWCFWSLAHNLGHRWWHAEMRSGKQTFYAHGEREHHRIYDAHGQLDAQHAEDPKELFISFPFILIAPVGLIFVAAYGYLFGWSNSIPFLIGLHGSMLVDHRLHVLFHKTQQLTGVLGWFQKMHQIHHTTHRNNFFFVSGLPWDLLFGTARTRLRRSAEAEINPGVS